MQPRQLLHERQARDWLGVQGLSTVCGWWIRSWGSGLRSLRAQARSQSFWSESIGFFLQDSPDNRNDR